MTLLLLSLVVAFLVIGEICGLVVDPTNAVGSRWYVASGIVGVLLAVWLFAVGGLPEAFTPEFWSGLNITLEKCTQPC